MNADVVIVIVIFIVFILGVNGPLVGVVADKLIQMRFDQVNISHLLFIMIVFDSTLIYLTRHPLVKLSHQNRATDEEKYEKKKDKEEAKQQQ